MRPVVIAVVIRNHWPATWCFLKGLHNLQDQSVREVVFVDNGSTDETLVQLQRHQQKVIRNPLNAVGRARNLAFDYAGDADVLTVDGDHILTNGCVDTLQRIAYRYNLQMLSPFAFYPNLTWLAQDAVYDAGFYEWYTIMRDDVLREFGISHKGLRRILLACYPNGLETAAQRFVRRHWTTPTVSMGQHWPGCVYRTRGGIAQLGQYDPMYRACAWEDVDYARQAMFAGGRVATTPRAFVHHFCSLTLRPLTPQPWLDAAVRYNEGIYRRKYGY